MACRVRLVLGLFAALSAAHPSMVRGAETNTIQWGPGAPPATTGSAEEAAALARQAAALAQRAAEMAAASQQPVSQQPTAPAAPALSPANATDAPAWKSSQPGTSAGATADIQFKKPTTALSTDLAPASPTDIAPAQAPSDDATLASALAEKLGHLAPLGWQSDEAAPPIETSPRTDDQLQLVSSAFMDNSAPAPTDNEPVPPPMPPVAPGADGYRPNIYMAEGCYDNYCAPAPPPLIWVAGVEATFLRPDVNSDGVTFEVEEIAEERWDWFSSRSSDTDSMYVSPRIWIGIQGCDWGTNLRYWHLQACESFFDPSVDDSGDWEWGVNPNVGVFASSRLEAYTIDWELTRRFCIHDCWMQASAGIRHASIHHGESIVGNAATSDANLFGYARSDRHTRGTGLLLGLYGRKPLFPCSSVHWFYNVRWSALWGPTETSVETFAAVLSEDATAGSVNGAMTAIDDTLYIGELQLGVEWNYALQCMPANAFFRAAVEYQRWDGGKGYSASTSFAGISVDDEFTTLATATGSAAEPQMDLVGITIGTGLTW